ncbi:MAG: DNA mismatch repair endonuclease MutL [Candidatus Promineifilaceae bacterium]
MSIQVLSDQLASQIAAGEVVERPSSVVKELIENAIDAGAKTINLDIRNGGRNLIQVADDGDGIPTDELEVAFMRHATSKLQSAEDLNTIHTLGFRGEALAAIAAVSRLTAVTRARNADTGTRLLLDGGHKNGRETVGAPQGTVIAVENLFYNIPARLKFLKSVTTERRLIDEYVTRYALAYPDVRFRLTHDNRITFQSNGSGQLMDVLVAVYGPDTARELLEIREEETAEEEKERTIQVSGYVGPPRLNWANRSHITLFVNGRWIKDNRLTYAVIQAYHTLLPTGRYPLAIVFLEMPPEQVDVNVHPTKAEVRFRQSNAAFGAVQRAVRQTIVADSPVRQAGHFTSFQSSGWAGAAAGHDPGSWNTAEWGGQNALGLDWSSGGELDGPITGSPPDMAGASGAMSGGGQIPIMRVVGQVGAAYIITEGPDGLYLIDQHAAHERILYEQFMAAWKENGSRQGIASQGLVTGAVVQLTPAQSALLEEHLELLSQVGFQVEPFGPNAYMVRSLPAIVAKLDPARALLDVIEDLERGDAPLQSKIEARIILRVCKSAAVKAGQTLSRQEMEAMIHQLENCHNPHTCPHGRPTLIHLSVAQLAREFGRT